MSASRAYNMLLRPAVFQPLGLFSFGLIAAIYIDRKTNAMNQSVSKAIDGLNSADNTNGDLPNNLTKRLNELESRFSSSKAYTSGGTHKAIRSSGASSTELDAIMSEINEIKSMSDLNMFDIQENFDKVNAEINTMKAISDKNICEIESDFNILKSNIDNIKEVSDTNMADIENELRTIKAKSDGSDELYDTLNKLQIQIEYIKETSDRNMIEIENNLQSLTSKFGKYENNIQEHYDAIMVAEKAFNELDERQKSTTYNSEEQNEKVKGEQNEIIGRLQDVEAKVYEHRDAFKVAEDALNNLISWKNEVDPQ